MLGEIASSTAVPYKNVALIASKLNEAEAALDTALRRADALQAALQEEKERRAQSEGQLQEARDRVIVLERQKAEERGRYDLYTLVKAKKQKNTTTKPLTNKQWHNKQQ